MKTGRTFLVLISLSIVSFSYEADPNDITRLRAQILQNYDRHTRPVQNNKDTTNLEIHFLNNGIEFDDKRGVMTLHLFAPMTWEDQHIKWDPLNYGNLTEITFSPTELWKPDMSLINNYDTSEIDHFSNTLMIVTSTSGVWWIPPAKFQAPCPTDFYLWPYDKQKCRFQISSWSYDGDELNVTVPENYTRLVIEDEWEYNLENREWELLDSLVERHSQVLYCCPEVSYIDILITVVVQRRSTSHTVAVTAVGIGISWAILISFWLSPFAEERVPLTLLVMLLNALYLQFMYNTIPKNGAAVPLTICFFRDSLIMTTFAFAWTVGIRYIAKTKRRAPVPLPDIVQNLLNSVAATILCLNPRPIDPKIQQAKASHSGDDGDVSELVKEDDSDFIQQDWEWLARLLDRLAFFLYLVTYIIFIAAFL